MSSVYISRIQVRIKGGGKRVELWGRERDKKAFYTFCYPGARRGLTTQPARNRAAVRQRRKISPHVFLIFCRSYAGCEYALCTHCNAFSSL